MIWWENLLRMGLSLFTFLDITCIMLTYVIVSSAVFPILMLPLFSMFYMCIFFLFSLMCVCVCVCVWAHMCLHFGLMIWRFIVFLIFPLLVFILIYFSAKRRKPLNVGKESYSQRAEACHHSSVFEFLISPETNKKQNKILNILNMKNGDKSRPETKGSG